MVVTALLFMKRMSDTSDIKSWKYIGDSDTTAEEAAGILDLPREIRVFEISGPMFFAAADKMLGITTKTYTKVLIIRMRSVPAIDISALRRLRELVQSMQKKGITVVFSHVNEQPMRAFEKDGFVELAGVDNFRADINDAIEYAKGLIAE